MASPLLDVPRVPHGRTARRLTWAHLPTQIRDLVARRLGSPVVDARSCDSGFTPGFASVLTGADGRRLFVKAASKKAQRDFAAAYAEEGRKLRLLGDRVPSPELLWVHEDDLWVVLGFEAVDGHAPDRPWLADELERALDLAEEIAAATVTVPAGLDLAPIWKDLPGLLTGWGTAAAYEPDWPHLEDAAGLAARLPHLPGADRFCHTDLRDDNVLLCADGRTLACDWNWPALGPAWLDLVTLLVAAHGDGHDADALLASRALTRDVPADHVDAWLAALCGFMMMARTRPTPSSSPFLWQHSNWYAEASWSWLAARRGWT
jgi:aminoglycoside phosphotransferase (APT) family kinase protein